MKRMDSLTVTAPKILLKEHSGEPVQLFHEKALAKPARFSHPAHQAVCAPKVAILICTYQGQPFLAEQLDSFAAQSHANWEVWASDDGSVDDTHQILETYQLKWGKQRLSVHAGPAEGFVANFLSLTCNTNIVADYYAYSDQDDIWEADKLQRAVEWLRSVPAEMPALYCSRALLVDIDNAPIGLSPLFRRKPDFANSLVQSIGGGNTMVFNEAARALLCKAGQDVTTVSHDCWVYMVVSGCGGQVFHDTVPTLRYRQHAGNLVGTNISWQARWSRGMRLWNGWFRSWNDRNVDALQRLRSDLTAENRRILDDFCAARKTWLLPRLWLFARSGIRRQSAAGNCALLIAAIFNKI